MHKPLKALAYSVLAGLTLSACGGGSSTIYTVIDGGHGINANDLTVNGVTILDLTINFIEAHIVGGTPLYETTNVD